MSDFKMPDLQSLMQAAQKIQGDVAKMQEELANKTCEASSGGGMVSVTINGHYELVSLKIDKEAVNPDDVDMLQDLILAAINDANRKAEEQLSKQMGGMMGGMKIPGL